MEAAFEALKKARDDNESDDKMDESIAGECKYLSYVRRQSDIIQI